MPIPKNLTEFEDLKNKIKEYEWIINQISGEEIVFKTYDSISNKITKMLVEDFEVTPQDLNSIDSEYFQKIINKNKNYSLTKRDIYNLFLKAKALYQQLAKLTVKQKEDKNEKKEVKDEKEKVKNTKTKPVEFDPVQVKESYAGLEIYFDGYRFVFGIAELLNIIFDLAQTYSQKTDSDKQKISNNLGKKDIVLGGGLLNWLTVAENIKQADFNAKDQLENKHCGFMLAGRRLEILSPSNRYVYDKGSEDSYSLQSKKSKLKKAEKIFLSSLLYQPQRLQQKLSSHSDFVAEDALPDEYIGYRFISAKLEASNLPDLLIAKQTRHALRGLEPARRKIKQKMVATTQNLSKKIVSSVKKFEHGEIEESEAQQNIVNFLKQAPLISDFQISGNDQLTDNMSEALPVLIMSWFIAEFSRNRSAFTVGKMLLDLIEAGTKLSCNDMPITLCTALRHPQMPLEGAIKDVDPNSRLSSIGGLHPMAHLDSYLDGYVLILMPPEEKIIPKELPRKTIVLKKEGEAIKAFRVKENKVDENGLDLVLSKDELKSLNFPKKGQANRIIKLSQKTNLVKKIMSLCGCEHSNECIQNPYHLDPQNLSWAHIKSGAIICEWLIRYLQNKNVFCKILDEKSYLASLNLREGAEAALKKQVKEYRSHLQNKIIGCENPETRINLFKRWEHARHDLYACEHGVESYRNTRQRAKHFISDIFDLLHDDRHKMLIPHSKPFYKISHLQMFRRGQNANVKPLSVTAPQVSEILSLREQKLINSLNYELKKYNQILEKNKNDAYAYYCRGAVLLKLKKYKEAFNDFTKSLQLEQNPYADLYLKAGIAAYELDELDDALFFLEEALDKRSGHAETSYYYGLALYRDNNKLYIYALEHIKESLIYNPKNADAHNKCAHILFFELGAAEEALNHCQASLLINPKQALPWEMQGTIYYKLNRKQDALDCYSKALKINPYRNDCRYNCGLIHFELGQYTQALIMFEEHLKINPGDRVAIDKRNQIRSKLNYPEAKSDNPGKPLGSSEQKSSVTFSQTPISSFSFGGFTQPALSPTKLLDKAMPQLGRWYNFGVEGFALQCSNENDAKFISERLKEILSGLEINISYQVKPSGLVFVMINLPDIKQLEIMLLFNEKELAKIKIDDEYNISQQARSAV